MAQALAVDRDDIEAVGMLGVPSLLQVGAGRAAQTSRFGRRDRLLGHPAIAPRLHLNKDDDVAIQRDHIEFSTSRRVAPGDQCVAQAQQMLGRLVFGLRP